jgi:enterochelin esterase-like enzyme
MKNLCLLVLVVFLSKITALGEQPCKSTVVGDLRIEHLQSKTYGNSVTLRIWLPPGYSDPANNSLKYPALYILDGQNAFDECTAFHGEHELLIDETVTKLISEHKIPPIIVVGIDSSSTRNYEYSPYRDPISDPRAPDPIGKQLPSFLADEVLPFISSHYRVTDNPADRGIGGTSLGASAALYVALNRPDVFRLALVESPNLLLGNGQLLRDTQFIVRAPDRVAIGVGETEVNFAKIEEYLAPMGLAERDTDPAAVKMVETLASNIKGAYFKHPDIMLVIQPGANHSSQYWAQRLPAAIEFLYREAAPSR